jgi:hypothetical protein
MDFLDDLCREVEDRHFSNYLRITLRSFVQLHTLRTPEFTTTAHYLIPRCHEELRIRYVDDRRIYAENRESLFRIHIADCIQQKEGAVQILDRFSASYFYDKEIISGPVLREKDFFIETPKTYDFCMSRSNGILSTFMTGNHFYCQGTLYHWYVRSITCREYLVLFVKNMSTETEIHYIIPQHFYRFNRQEKRLVEPFFLRGEIYYVAQCQNDIRGTKTRCFKDVVHEDPHGEEKWFEEKSEGQYHIIHAASIRSVAVIPVSKVYSTQESIVFLHGEYIHYFRM